MVSKLQEHKGHGEPKMSCAWLVQANKPVVATEKSPFTHPPHNKTAAKEHSSKLFKTPIINPPKKSSCHLNPTSTPYFSVKMHSTLLGPHLNYSRNTNREKTFLLKSLMYC